jgi:hypothetical protein
MRFFLAILRQGKFAIGLHSLISFATMDGLGDCPQFVSMLNSAAENLLSARAINNEGGY